MSSRRSGRQAGTHLQYDDGDTVLLDPGNPHLQSLVKLGGTPAVQW